LYIGYRICYEKLVTKMDWIPRTYFSFANFPRDLRRRLQQDLIVDRRALPSLLQSLQFAEWSHQAIQQKEHAP